MNSSPIEKLRVTVEAVDETDPKSVVYKHLGTAMIVETDVSELITDPGIYECTFSKFDDPKKIWRESRINDFPKDKLGPWDLLFRLLRVAVGHRNRYRVNQDGPSMQKPFNTPHPPGEGKVGR